MKHTFNVGDRARVVRSDVLPNLVGEQTVITEVMGLAYHAHPDFPADVWYCTELRFGDGDACVFPAGALEPIWYDGQEPAKWNNCVWQPSQVSV